MEREAVLRVVAWVVLAAGPAAAQIDAFDWQLAGNPAGTGSAMPTNLHVIGPDSGGCTPPVTYFETQMPVGGTLSVLVDFQNLDSYTYKFQDWYDAPAWVIDDVWDMPPSTGKYPYEPTGWPTGPYEFQLDVEAGQHIGLGVWSADCSEGPGVADFHDLVFTPKAWSTHAAALDPRVLWTADVPASQPALAAIGDVDLDGVGDLAESGYFFFYPFQLDLRILSGATGGTLLEPPPLSDPERVSAVGDMDGDGIPDIATSDADAGAPGMAFAGRADVRSGADGSALLEVLGTAEWNELGTSLTGPGDVDLDGVPDLAVGLRKPFSNKSEVRLVSGATGALLHSWLPSFKTNSYGFNLGAPGDVTGDGVPDLLIAGSTGGAVDLISGATSLVAESFSQPGALSFGQALAGAGDVDGGGAPDVVIGAPGDNGSVFVFSGESTSVITTIVGAPSALLGAAVAGGDDVNGDGRLDVVASAVGEGLGGVVHVFDALDGSPIAELHATIAKQWLGASVALPGDLDGDGRGDVAALSAPTDGQHPVQVRAWKDLDHPGAPTIEHAGDPIAYQLISVTVSHVSPGATGWLVLGGALVDLPVAGGLLAPAPEMLVPLVAGADGVAHASGRWPAGLPTWTSLWMQAWMADPTGPAGFSATDALAASQL